MTIPMADLARQHAALKAEIEAAVREVLASGRYVGGPVVQRFEQALGARFGRHAIGTSSGTTALHTALSALGVGPGDEVVVPSYTFCATAEAVLHCGATPRFADVDDHGNLDARSAEGAINERTRGLIAVHLFGRCAAFEPLRALAKARDLFLVEDCAQAFGASSPLGDAGTLGDAACFSFFPAKILGAAGDAGAVTTARPDLAERMRLLVNHGRRTPETSDRWGYNHRLDALQAAVLEVKLRHVDAFVARRRRLAARYREAFVDLPLELPAPEPGHAYQAFCVLSDARDALMDALARDHVATAAHYRVPLHRQRAFAEMPREDLPMTERLAPCTLCLPVHPELTDDEVDRVIGAVRAFFGRSVAR
jgi:dTDP-4-amino-4,6-dideoxygalactose transaminase